jgi:hypothetical protein
MNDGFTKITMKRTSTGDTEDGWVVNLNNIGIKNSTLGNGYDEVVENSEIIFGDEAPDVYVYDANGEVYYAKGYKDGNDTIYSQTYTKESEIVEPDNPADWVFDSETGILSRYIGPDVETLLVPNYIRGIKVNSIKSSGGSWGLIYEKNVHNVIISNGILEIGEDAFNFCPSITNITIPDSVTKIESFAFANSDGLTSITIPKGITRIGSYAFSNSNNLTNVTIPNNVTSLGYGAFQGCIRLTQITVNTAENLIKGAPWGTTSTNIVWTGDPFVDFENPDNWTFDSSTGTISKYIGQINLETLIVPEYIGGIKVKEIKGIGNNGITYGRNTKNVIISEGITTIGKSAFNYCSNLVSVTIPSGITTIGESAFFACNKLANISLPNTITSIGRTAFYGCEAFTNITIPNSVTTIGSESFEACFGLTNIIVPNNVTNIEYGAFSNCTKLESITLSNNITKISDNLFEGCTKLASITILNGVTSIEESAFYNCTSLESITIPSTVTSIGDYTFSNCTSLCEISIKRPERYIEGMDTKWEAPNNPDILWVN